MISRAMALHYKATSIGDCDAARAYPLIQVMRPDISLDAWRRFIASLQANCDDTPAQKRAWPSCGIIAIESQRGYFHGLFSYITRCTIDHEAVLEVSNFVAMDMLDRALAVKTLLSVLEDLAQILACTAIHTQVSGDWCEETLVPSQMTDHFYSAGHMPKYMNLCKPVPAPV